MVIYRVQAPDGSIIQIEGPENATEEQIQQAAAAAFAQMQAAQPAAPQPAEPQPAAPAAPSEADLVTEMIVGAPMGQSQMRFQSPDLDIPPEIPEPGRAPTAPPARAPAARAPAPAPTPTAPAPTPEAPSQALAPMEEAPPIPAPQSRGVIGGIVEAVTGRERATEATRTLPEWTSMPELNSFSFRSALTGLGTFLAGPEEIVQVVQSNFPATEVFQDEKGNFIIRSSIDGRDYAIPPGFSVGDIPRAIGGFGAFTPAGRATTIAGAAGGSAATQAAIEATQMAAGSQQGFPEMGMEVGTAGAFGAATPVVGRAIQAARQPRQAVQTIEERIEPTLEGIPLTPPQAPRMTQKELVETTIRAATPSRVPGRQTRATQILVGETAPDPKVVQSAQRLGIEEFLQPDHVTTNQVYRELAQAVKSVPGSQARQLEIQGLNAVGKRANDLIDEIGGTRDYSTLGAKVQSAMQNQVDELAARTETLFTDVINKAIPKRAEVSPDNILTYLRTRADDLGGFQNLSSAEKEIYRKLAPKRVKQTVSGQTVEVEKLPTYALLDDVRKDIGSAYKQAGPFKDADRAELDRIYGLLSQDQAAVAARYGVDDALKAANQAVQLRKGIERDMTALFGKQLHQSMVGDIEGAIKALAKGDEKKLIGLIKAVPKEMRQEVVASGLKTAFGRAAMDRPISFNDFATWYQGLLENKQAYSALMTNLPSGARKQLSDLYRVSNSIAKASKERIVTGRLGAITDQLKNADSLIGNIVDIAKRGAVATTLETGARAAGIPGAGVSAAIASALTRDKTPKQKAADALLASQEFLQASKLASQGQTDAAAKSLARSRAFTKFAKEMEMPKEMDWKTQWILRSMQTERQLADEEQ
jgi:hypothetical protein